MKHTIWFVGRSWRFFNVLTMSVFTLQEKYWSTHMKSFCFELLLRILLSSILILLVTVINWPQPFSICHLQIICVGFWFLPKGFSISHKEILGVLWERLHQGLPTIDTSKSRVLDTSFQADITQTTSDHSRGLSGISRTQFSLEVNSFMKAKC
jgi:hypothetical protein